MLLSFKLNKNEMEIFGKNFNYLFLGKYFSGAQGELFSKLRNQGLIYRLDSDYSCFFEDSLFNIAFETSKEKIKQIVDIINREVKNVVENGVDQKYIDSYKDNFDYLSDEKMPVKMSTTCHINLMDYFSFGKIFNLTERQKKKLKNEVNIDGVIKVAREIFNKKTKMYVTVLGNVTKKFVPPLDYFEKNFLIWE